MKKYLFCVTRRRELCGVCFLIMCSGLFLCLASCDISKNKKDERSGFTKIYDLDSMGISYTPVDIKEMADGGFIILAYTDKSNGGVYLLRTDKSGHFLWNKYFTEYINPVSELLQIGSDIYFFSIAYPFSTGTILLKINDSQQTADLVRSYQDNLKPLAASKTPDNGFLIEKYDAANERTVLSKLTASFDPDLAFDKDGNKEYDIQITDVIDDKINNHILHQGEQLPFFTGYLGETSATYYYFNGFYKTDLSLVFVDVNTGNLLKRLTGYRYQKCSTSLTDLGNNKVAFSRFEYDENLLVSLLDMGLPTTISGNSDFGGTTFNDLEARATIRSKKIVLNGRELLVLIGNTKGNTVGMFAYDALTGKFSGAKYFGNTYPYKIGNFITTADGGMAVLCQTFVTGRFARVCLYKLSMQDLAGLYQ
jgi:hypothetical protein